MLVGLFFNRMGVQELTFPMCRNSPKTNLKDGVKANKMYLSQGIPLHTNQLPVKDRKIKKE